MSELTRKKNEASEIMFAMVDSTTPANLKSGLTVTDTPYYKDGAGSWTALSISDASTEIGTTGMYTIEMTAAELNHDLILIKLTATGAADTIVVIRTTTHDIDDVNTVVPDAAGVAPTAAEIKTEIEQAGSSLAQILTDTDDLQTNQGAWATATGFATATICTEARLAELDAENIPSDVDAILTDTGTTLDGKINTIDANVDTILTDTNELQTDWVNGGRLDLLLDAIPTTAMRGTDNAATPAEVATALSNIHLDHLLAADYDPTSKPGMATALLNELIENDGGVSRYTANALEQAPSGGTNPNVLVDTTISSVTDQTHFVLTAGSNDDDAYKNQAIVIYDASNGDFPSVRVCSGYTGSTKTITLDSAPDFTIVGGDGVKAFVTAPGTTAPTSGQNADAVCDELLSGHVTAGSLAKAISDALADTNELQTNQGDWLTADITTLALEASLNDIKGTGFVKDTHSLPQCLTATGFSVPNEYNTAIAALQTDLDNPAQYKADVSALATTTALSTAQADLDTITGSDGVTLATQQLNYAPNTVIPDAMGTAAGLHATTNGKVDAVQTDATTIKAKTDNLPSGLAKNVAVPKFDVFMVLTSDHVTGATGKTVTGTISKDGGAFAALTNPITEVDAGMYTIASGLTQEERNADVSTLKFSADGCDDRIITIISS